MTTTSIAAVVIELAGTGPVGVGARDMACGAALHTVGLEVGAVVQADRLTREEDRNQTCNNHDGSGGVT